MGVSIRPSEFVEGGAVPVDMNLLWKECRFNLFDYAGKAKATTAARIKYVSDGGTEYDQQYSVGDPERFIPSQDGKTLVAVGEAQSLSKSSNFSVLMNALINAGFPENKLPESGDISVLDGLYTFNIGLPEPKRSGLARPVEEGARPKVMSVPSQILRLPWEKKGGKKVAAKVATEDEGGEEGGEGDEAIAKKALDLVAKAVKTGGGTTTRQKIGVAVFKDLAKDPDKDAVASTIFSAEFQGTLLANGYKISGEEVSK